MKKLLLLLFGTMLFQFARAKDHDSTSTKRFHDFRSAIILGGSDPITMRPGLLSPLFFSDITIGAYYQLRIAKHFGVKVGYSGWNNTPLYHIFLPSWVTIQTGKYPITFDLGSILNSYDYKASFCYFQYIFNVGKRWKVYPQVGLSYAYVYNQVVDSVYVNPGPPYDAIVYQSGRKAHYWGVIPALSIDYLCNKGRLRLGADISRLKYTGFYYHPVDYGFHAGFNF